jgi:hypothetical protein
MKGLILSSLVISGCIWAVSGSALLAGTSLVVFFAIDLFVELCK